MKLKIQTLTGETFEIQVDPDATIKQVKVRIENGVIYLSPLFLNFVCRFYVN